MADERDVSFLTQTWRDISGSATAGSILARLGKEGRLFEFDTMDHDEPTRTKFDVKRASILWTENISTQPDLVYGGLILERRKAPHTNCSIFWQRAPTGKWLNYVGIGLDEGHFRDHENVERFLRLFADISLLLGAGYGAAYHRSEWEQKDYTMMRLRDGTPARTTISLKPQEGLVDLYWANFLGSPYVKLFGRERIVGCPGARVQEVANETYLLTFGESPFDWQRPGVLQLSERAKDYLGRDVFYDRNHPERTPRAPDWPPGP